MSERSSSHDSSDIPRLVYLLTSWQEVPLAHYSGFMGTFQSYCQQLLPLLDSSQEYVFRYGEYLIYTQRGSSEETSSFIFLVMCEVNYPQQLVQQLLGEMEARFFSMYPAQSLKFPARYEMHRVFSRVLQSMAERYAHHLTNTPEDKNQEIELIDLSLQRQRFQKMPLLVQNPPAHTAGYYAIDVNETAEEESWPLRHPILFIGCFVLLAIGVFVYIVVIIPVCGYKLQEKINGEHICWYPSA